jgi:hypothetical protein
MYPVADWPTPGELLAKYNPSSDVPKIPSDPGILLELAKSAKPWKFPE